MQNMNPIPFFCYLLVFTWVASTAQTPLQSVQQWQTHLPYTRAISVANAPNAIFYATDLALFEVVKKDQSIRYHNKVTGLNDVGVSTIAYNTSYDLLVVAYKNGNIDLLNALGQVANLPAIKQNSNIGIQKEINHIYCDSNLVYLSCDFGLVVLDVEIGEFTQNTFTPMPVNASTRLNDKLFIATPEGIYVGDQSFNLLDFSNWELQGMAQGLGTYFYDAETCMTLKGRVYGDINDTVMVYENGIWQHLSYIDDNGRSRDTFTTGKPHGVFATDPSQEHLYIVPGKNYFRDFVITYELNSKQYSYRGFPGYSIQDVAVDEANNYWIADLSSGASKATSDGTTILAPGGPANRKITDMSVSNDGTLWCVGSLLNEKHAQFDPTGAYRYEAGRWSNYNQSTLEDGASLEFLDYVRVKVDDNRNKAYIGSFMHGILELNEDGTWTKYDHNSPGVTLQQAVGDVTTRILGLELDADGNLWIANTSADFPISVLRTDGTWKSFDVPATYSGQIADIAIDRNGYKWFRQTTGNVMVFDEGEMDVNGDEHYIQITTSNNLPSSQVNCLVADRNGIIWVGTDDGVAIFSNCRQDIFQNSCTAERPVINPDDFNGRLLEAENVKTIAVDGGNRKWVGTDNGVFLLNQDYEQVYFFDEENSPLLDNQIIKIVIDPQTGLVYMATEQGLISFRGVATEGRLVASKEKAYVFPNPVRPNYEGPITVTGLVENVNVKITDASGRLVYENEALGGQMIWNGSDYNGKRVSSGVYMVFTVDDMGREKLLTKVAVIN